MKKQHLRRNKPVYLFLALLFLAPFPKAEACNTSGYIIDNLIDNGNGTYTIEMTVLVAGGNTTSVGSTWGFYWNVDVPILSVAPPSLTSSNGTVLTAVITGNSIAWGDPEPSAATPFLDINVSFADETFPVTVVVQGAPTEWDGGGQEGNNCPGGPGASASNYMGCFPPPPTSLTLSTCDGGTVIYAGQTLAEGTVTDVTLTAANGCDSIVAVTVVGTGPLTGTATVQACQGQMPTYQGVEIPPGTSMDFSLTGTGGCDSIVTVTALEALPPTFGSDSVQACGNEMPTYQGVEMMPGTVMDFTLTNADGCDSVVTVTALEPLPLSFGADTFGLCLGASLEIFGQTITAPGIYSQTYMAANGCDSVHTVFVKLEPGPALEMPETATVGLGDELVLRPTVGPIGQVTYEWFPDPTLNCPNAEFDCPNPTVQPVNPTTYILTITDSDGCETLDSVEILVNKRRQVFIPNSFSPNGDGINDFFLVFAHEKSVARINSFRVFSRWGELVFENFNFPPNDANFGWDGTFLEEDMDASVFVYTAEVEFIDGEILQYRGDVFLVTSE